jgi:hypothetical protein
MIVVWHEGPGTPSPQESRPVGYGVIRAGVLHRFEDWREEISNAVSLSRINWQRAMAYSASVSRGHIAAHCEVHPTANWEEI